MRLPATGGCQCGAIRHRLVAPASWTGYCHCLQCQRAHGAPLVLWLTVPAGGIVFDRGSLAWHRSSPRAERGFCVACGSPLAWKATSTAAEDPGIDIAAASLDDTSDLRPEVHLWCESAVPGFSIADDLPRLPRGRAG